MALQSLRPLGSRDRDLFSERRSFFSLDKPLKVIFSSWISLRAKFSSSKF